MRGRNHIGRIVAVLLAIGLVAAACGDDGDTTSSGTTAARAVGVAEARRRARRPALGYFGPLTGDAANLGINIQRGVELALEQWNKANPDCQVKLTTTTRRATPKRPRPSPTKPSPTTTILGIVGPAFSGESKAVDPKFDEAGLPIISASATNPDLSKNGWKIFHRLLATDAKQGPDVAKYIKDTHEGRTAVVRHRRPERVRQGSRRRRARPTLGDSRRRHRLDRPERDRLLGSGHQGQGRRTPTSSSSAATTTRPASS